MSDTIVTSADGTELAARCTGRGTPIVLVHGGLGDIDSFVLVEGRLAERHSVWVYSRRGRGRGRGGSGEETDYSVEREVEDLLAVVEAAGGNVHLVGHSAGAVYSLSAAMQSPRLRSLVLYEPPLRLADNAVDPSVFDDVQSAIDVGNRDLALETFFPVAGVVEHEVQALRSLEPAWQRMRTNVDCLPREAHALVALGDRLTSFDPPDVPTLYLYGTETDCPAIATVDKVAEMFPNARRRGLSGERHLAPVFDPTSFAAAIVEFTADHDA